MHKITRLWPWLGLIGLSMGCSYFFYWIQLDVDLDSELQKFIQHTSSQQKSDGYLYIENLNLSDANAVIKKTDNHTPNLDEFTINNSNNSSLITHHFDTEFCSYHNEACWDEWLNNPVLVLNESDYQQFADQHQALSEFTDFKTDYQITLSSPTGDFSGLETSFMLRLTRFSNLINSNNLAAAQKLWQQDFQTLRTIMAKTNDTILKFIAVGLLSNYLYVANHYLMLGVFPHWPVITEMSTTELQADLWWASETVLLFNTIDDMADEFSESTNDISKRYYYKAAFKPNRIKNKIYNIMQEFKANLSTHPTELNELQSRIHSPPELLDIILSPNTYFDHLFLGIAQPDHLHRYHLRVHNLNARIRLFNIAQEMRSANTFEPEAVAGHTKITNPFFPEEIVRLEDNQKTLRFDGPGKDHRNLRQLKLLMQ